MKNYPMVSRALLKASSGVQHPATEILWHMKAAFHFGDMLSEQTLRGHLDQARQHAESVLKAINDVQLEIDRVCRENHRATVVSIGNGSRTFAEQQAGVEREITRIVPAQQPRHSNHD